MPVPDAEWLSEQLMRSIEATPLPANVPALLEVRAQAQPERMFLDFFDDGDPLSYGEMARLVLASYKPFDDDAPEGLREAMFHFQSIGARVLNGQLRETRSADGPGREVWEIEDAGRWLWWDTSTLR